MVCREDSKHVEEPDRKLTGPVIFLVLASYPSARSPFRPVHGTMIRVVIPFHLRTLASISGEVQLDVPAPVTQRTVLDALEARYPMLRGTIRDHVTQERRAFLRFFACEQDLSNEAPDTPLPEAVIAGTEPYLVIGALAGG